MESESTKQIKRGAVISYSVIVFNMLAGLIYTPWMISKIGQQNFGLYTLANSLITMFLMDFGMSMAVSRFVAKYVAEGRQQEADNFLGLAYKLYLLMDMIIFVVLSAIYFFIERIYANLAAEEIAVFKEIYLIVALFSILTFPFVSLNGVLSAYEKYVPLKLCELFHKVFIVVTVVIALLCGGTVVSLVMLNALAGILTTAIKLLVIHQQTPIHANLRYFSRELLSETFSFSAWTTLSSIAQRLIYNITPTIIAAISVTGAVGVAVFGLASTIEGYVYTFAAAINGLFVAKVSRLVYRDHDRDGMMELAIVIGRIQCILIGVLIAGFISVGRTFIIEIWNKPDFARSYLCAIFLIIPSYLYLPMEIMNTALVVENKVRLQAIVFLLTGGLNLALAFPLVHKFGPVGGAVSIMVSYTVRSILMAVIYHKSLQLDMRRFMRETYLKITPTLILITICGLLLEHGNPMPHTAARFLFNGCLVVLIAIALMWSVVLRPNEKKMISGIFLKHGKKRQEN